MALQSEEMQTVEPPDNYAQRVVQNIILMTFLDGDITLKHVQMAHDIIHEVCEANQGSVGLLAVLSADLKAPSQAVRDAAVRNFKIFGNRMISALAIEGDSVASSMTRSIASSVVLLLRSRTIKVVEDPAAAARWLVDALAPTAPSYETIAEALSEMGVTRPR